MRHLHSLLVASLLLGPVTAAAEPSPSPYAGERGRAIKALSDDDIAGLLRGDGLGFAKAAELNGYPGPRHALDLGATLQLTASQRSALEQIFARMQAAATALGRQIVEREAALDRLFIERHADAARIAALTDEIGDLAGRLRAAHLAAHVETTALLGPEQVAAYNRLRGYGAEADKPGVGAHGGHKH
jgi:Spy/CpxP family protein refolding chaperone